MTPESYLAGTPLCRVCRVQKPMIRGGREHELCGDCHEKQSSSDVAYHEEGEMNGDDHDQGL